MNRVSRSSSHSSREVLIPLVLTLGDMAVTFGALALSWWLRYASPVGRLGLDVPDATFRRYLPLLLAGVGLLIAAFLQFGLYDTRFLLRRYQSLNAILKGAAFWLVAYLGLSLVLEFNPPISRLFVVLAFILVVLLLSLWRLAIFAFISRSSLLQRLRRRTVLLGWNEEAAAIAEAVAKDPAHPLVLVGTIGLPGEASDRPDRLGDLGHLDAILEREQVNLVIATRLDMARDQLREAVECCERHYVEWKIVPAAFDIFLSGLRLQTIGRVPVLGVEELKINRFLSRATKRAIDLIGGAIGCVVAAPVMLVVAILIRRESPGESALFRQTRVGVGHRTFTLYKLRSMTPEASAADHDNQSTHAADPRLLKVGGTIRRWNLDELPQFWNVLKGDMSLVGPRPERPYHVDRLADTIPHYLPRHLVKPGMTGWAQVNGLRGASDLAARVQHDIYYIENWSVWLDVQILGLTVVRWKDEPVP